MNEMREPRLTRRDLLKGGGGALIAMTILPGGLIVGGNKAWAATAKALKPESFATLVQACRDIYPHDHLADAFYAKVVGGLDAAAAGNDGDRQLLENGVSALDDAARSAHGVDGYVSVGWEAQRAGILRGMESDPFFQKLRGSLVTGIYNNTDAWPLFGYEGESASKGGYINRGFDDIDWLDQV